jgi:hypothetical protein
VIYCQHWQLLGSLLHLVVTTWLAYITPLLILGGVVSYFPGYPKAAYTATYIVLALGISFLGGTILGRTRVWRGRVALLAGLVWLLAAIVTVPRLLEGSPDAVPSIDLVATMVLDLAPLLLAVGLTAGLYVGARIMRPYDRGAEPPNKSLEQTHEG